MNAEQLKAKFEEDREDIRKQEEMLNLFHPLLPVGFNKLNFCSPLNNCLFLNEAKTLLEVFDTMEELKSLELEFESYYLSSNDCLAMKFNTNLGPQVIMFCREVEKALDFFSNGNCKLEKTTKTETSQYLTCTVDK